MRSCKVCGASAALLIHLPQNDVDVAECSSCRLVFVARDFTADELDRAYGTLDSDAYYAEVSLPTAGKAERSVADLDALGVSSILDVGCGFGHLLEEATRAGMTAEGFEIGGRVTDVCAEKGLTVHTGALESVPGGFDAVTLLDVAEHLPNPLHTFETCRKLGKVLYVHTPRVCAWDRLFLALARLPGGRPLARRWLNSRVSVFHLQLWSDLSLRTALKRTGWQVISYQAVTELSWPVERYVETYGKFLPRPLALALARAILPTLRNKAIVTARQLGDRDNPPTSPNVSLSL